MDRRNRRACETVHKCRNPRRKKEVPTLPALRFFPKFRPYVVMQFRVPLALAALAAVAGCVPGSPIYFGPPLSTLEGRIYDAERATPLARAEVCIFGADTLCLRSTEDGGYKFQVFEQIVSMRFRGSGFSTAMIERVQLVTDSIVVVDCALTSRLVVSDRPIACLPIPRQ